MAQAPLLELHKISVQRGGKRVLRDFSLSIAVGEHVALLGPNGCGKSTLIQLLTRDLYPLQTPGSHMRIFGQDTWNVFDLRPLLGIVTNELMVRATRDITAAELALTGFFSSLSLEPYHEVTSAMCEKTEELLDFLEIPHLADRPLTEMSSGEARRALIARALVHDPKALVLDEPTNSLDLAAQHDLRNAVSKLAQSGVAILLVTHHLADIVPEIERVLLMQDGRIVADGSKAEMLTEARLSALFGTRVRLYCHDGYYHAS
jgi:iron complex transport system ATP-binding protein